MAGRRRYAGDSPYGSYLRRDQRLPGGADGSSCVPGNALYLHDHPRFRGVHRRRLRNTVAHGDSTGGWFRSIFKIQVGGQNIPIGFLWIILLVIVMSFVLNHTKMGRYTRAIGSNKEATRLSGVNVKFYHIMAYVICGLFAGLAAIAYSAIFATVQPGSGAGFELDAIGGAIVGGVSMSGAVGSITGTLIGVFVICLLKTGLPFIGLTANWQQIITGFRADRGRTVRYPEEEKRRGPLTII